MAFLSHPLVGRDRLIAGATIVGFVLVCLAGILLSLLDGRFGEWESAFDPDAANVGLVLASLWAFAILYGWVNGGPALTALLGLVPLGIGAVMVPALVTSTDVIIGIAGASVAVWLAAWVSYAPEERPEHVVTAFFLGVLVTALAGVSLWYGDVTFEGTDPMGSPIVIGLLGTAVLFGGIWSIAHAAQA